MTTDKTMKTLQIEAPGKAVWREAPLPEPGQGEALVRVLGVTTCPHWDMHLMDGNPMFPGHKLEYPLLPGVPGHEAAGEIAALGPEAEGLPVGTRVAAWRDTGRPRPGFYAQYNTFAVGDLLAVPASLAPAETASLELAMCVEVAFQRLAECGGAAGRRVGVCGLGPGGLVAVQLARAHGAREVVGIDPVEARRHLAGALGAAELEAGDPSRWPASRRDARALDVAIDCTGLAPAIEFLLDRTRLGVALFGVLRGEVRYKGAHMWGPGVSLVGYGNHNRTAAETALSFISDGRLRLSPLVTHTLPFTRYAEGVELLRRKEAIKVLFDPWA